MSAKQLTGRWLQAENNVGEVRARGTIALLPELEKRPRVKIIDRVRLHAVKVSAQQCWNEVKTYICGSEASGPVKVRRETAYSLGLQSGRYWYMSPTGEVYYTYEPLPTKGLNRRA